jgi:hypothetical protein
MPEDEAAIAEACAAKENLSILRARIPGILAMPEGPRKRARLHKIQRRAWDELEHLTSRRVDKEARLWGELGLRL